MKKTNLLSMIALGAVLFAGCTKDNGGVIDDPNENPVTGAPVETGQANTNYAAAFAGQTRIGSVKTTTAIESKIITSSLSSPWDVAVLPDGRLLVTEKGGNMKIVTTAGAVSAPLTGVPSVVAGGQGGLLGVCLDPQFSNNRMVYWVFTAAASGGNQTAVAKGRLSNNDSAIESATIIYRANPAYSGSLHFGGRIVFDQTGNLLVSTGERSDLATRPLAQSVSSALGKIVRITTSGAAASGNPTFSGAGALPELYSIGHRNPQGLAIHPTTGQVWESEHGPRGGDELNLVKAGANYGWPTITYGIEYGGQPIGSAIQQQNGMEQPAYYWDPVISPSGMTFYKGNRVPEWQNNLFIGALSGTHIVRLVINSNNKVVGEERLLADQGQRFRDVTQGADQALYAVTDGGRLYRIDKK